MRPGLTAKGKTGPVAKQMPVLHTYEADQKGRFVAECATSDRSLEAVRRQLALHGMPLYGTALSGLVMCGREVPDVRGAWMLLRHLRGGV